MNTVHSKDHNIGSYRTNKTSLSSYNDQKYIPTMDTVSYHIFINLLVNNKKNNFIEHEQFNFCSSQNGYFIHNFFSML